MLAFMQIYLYLCTVKHSTFDFRLSTFDYQHNMKLTLLVVGKTVGTELPKMIDTYVQRLKHYIPFEIQVIPDLKNTKSLTEAQQKQQEGEAILRAVDGSYVVLLDEHGKEYYHYPLESEYTADEVHEMAESGYTKIEIHGGGMGCALIKTDVFMKVTYPWYDWVNYGDANRGMLSEDLYFCELCRNSHIPIYADVRVGCGHLLRHVQWPVPMNE